MFRFLCRSTISSGPGDVSSANDDLTMRLVSMLFQNSGIKLASELAACKMSDIKYIIVTDVEDEEGEQSCRCTSRPFPCLAVTRYAAAGVVAVLAVTVVSMVIRAMLRSEDIRLFVNNGYIGADSLWVTVTKTTTTNEAAQIIGVDADSGAGDANDGQSSQISHDPQAMPNIGTSVGGDYPGYAGDLPRGGGSSKGCYLGCSGGGGGGTNFYNPPPSPPATQVTLQPATETNLRVILVVNNPGGRSKIDCSGTVVNVSDAANPRQEIAGLVLSNFTVPEQTIITLQKRVKVTDPAVLRYIWDRYRGRPAFDVVVRVSSSVVSYPLGTKTEPKRQTYTCRSVTLGLVQDEASFANQVDCTAEDDKERPTGAPAAAPMLAPAPEPVT